MGLEKGSSDDSLSGGNQNGCTAHSQPSNAEINEWFRKNRTKGLDLLHQHRRLEIADRGYRGAQKRVLPEETEEIYQATMMALVVKARKWKNKNRRSEMPGDIVDYAYRVAYRKGQDYLRKRVRREKRVVAKSSLVVDQQENRDSSGDGDGPGKNSDLLSEVHAFVNQLHAPTAEIARQRFLVANPLTLDELAEMFKISVSTVKRVLAWIRRQIEQLLIEKGYVPSGGG